MCFVAVVLGIVRARPYACRKAAGEAPIQCIFVRVEALYIVTGVEIFSSFAAHQAFQEAADALGVANHLDACGRGSYQVEIKTDVGAIWIVLMDLDRDDVHTIH